MVDRFGHAPGRGQKSNQQESASEQHLQAVEAGRAILLGLALGDALGMPTEFRTMSDIKQIFGRQGIQQPPRPALFTDDTQMTIAVACALIRHAHAPIDTLMKEMAKQFVLWGESPDNNRAPGLSCMAGVQALASGSPWNRAGDLSAVGCGSAMRVAPIGFVYQNEPERLKEVAIASSLPTHRHPSAIESAVAAAYLIKLALDGVTPTDMPDRVVDFVRGRSSEFIDSFQKLHQALSIKNEEQAMDFIGQGWVGHQAVPLALYCVIKYPDSWIETVRRGANFSGDSDSIASIAGGIQAARLGLTSIPPSWLSQLERRAELMQLGAQLAGVRS